MKNKEAAQNIFLFRQKEDILAFPQKAENNLTLVYSTNRVKGEALLELNIKNKDDFFNKIEYFSNK